MVNLKERSFIRRAVLFSYLAGAIWWGLYLVSPPAPAGLDTSPDRFSARRAYHHVEAIASAPHMVGTEHHEWVRHYLLEELKKLGLEPAIREGVGSSQFNHLRVVQTRNIVARMEGSRSERTILLMAHYDSVPYSYGAADDAAGVSAILETVRALRAEGSLKNDLILLFTDGEELGLMGARQFVQRDSLAGDIDLVINLEARGSSGSSIMFETNAGNANLIPMFAEAAVDPVANSLTYEVYNILPNDTDFTLFKALGIQGFNFGFIEDYMNYHTMLDSPRNLSLGSLQHHGDNLLALVRQAEESSLSVTGTADLVYFNGPFGGLLYYPAGWVPWLTAAALSLFLVILVRELREGRASLMGVLQSAGIYLAAITISCLAAWYSWDLIREYLYPEYRHLQHGETYAREWYLWFYLGGSALISVPLLYWNTYKTNIFNSMLGIYLICFISLIALTLFLPGGSYLVLWPLLFCLAGYVAGISPDLTEDRGWTGAGAAALLLLPTLYLLPFHIKLVHVALTTRLVAVSLVLFILMIGLAWPLLFRELSAAKRIGTAYMVPLLVMTGSILGAAFTSEYSDRQKKPVSLIYAQNLDTESAYWLSDNREPGEWISHFLGKASSDSTFPEFHLSGGRNFRYAAADPPGAPTSPHWRVTGDSGHSVRIQSPPNGQAAAARIEIPRANSLLSVTVDGESVFRAQPGSVPPGRIDLYRAFMKAVSIDLTYEGNRSASIDSIVIVQLHPQLPSPVMERYPDRPSRLMPHPYGFTFGTLWKQTFPVVRTGIE